MRSLKYWRIQQTLVSTVRLISLALFSRWNNEDREMDWAKKSNLLHSSHLFPRSTSGPQSLVMFLAPSAGSRPTRLRQTKFHKYTRWQSMHYHLVCKQSKPTVSIIKIDRVVEQWCNAAQKNAPSWSNLGPSSRLIFPHKLYPVSKLLVISSNKINLNPTCTQYNLTGTTSPEFTGTTRHCFPNF